jgi:hypothetical protein
MSSNAKLLDMDTQQNINFTEKEINRIETLVNLHKGLHSRAITLHTTIDESKKELELLIRELESVKTEELKMYKELSEKYDLSENTISQAAANHIISQKN